MRHWTRWVVSGVVIVAVSGTVPAAVMAQGSHPDPRVGLHGGKVDSTGMIVAEAASASWNMRLLSNTRAPAPFLGQTNSDLAFHGKYVLQGNYAGPLMWDISDPSHPVLAKSYVCPASQNDVSIYRNLMFVSSEAPSGRLDCGAEGVHDTVSAMRMRGVRIFDVTDITNPRYIANVQTCRGSHTHTVVTDPNDPDDVYIYVSGQAGVRSPNELPGCSSADPEKDPNSSRFRIEVIKVPLAHPEQAAIVTSPRIFNDLAPPPTHGEAATELAALDSARKVGAYVADAFGQHFILPPGFINPMLDSVVKARNGTGAPTAADSAALHAALQGIIDKMVGAGGPPRGPDQCHDITVYPAIGLAGGACAGYGLLLDIHDAAHPVRIDAVSDSNFSYWHSATFSNDGHKVLFTDEWGGGGAPKCRATDRPEWGADAIFTIDHGKLTFHSYYKMLAPQTPFENCVAHNGSLIPVPGRDIMVQSWYQGGVSVFDWTDPDHPKEIAFFDRGPVDSTKLAMGGSWSAYWYNGVIVSSEIARGLDILELTPNPLLSQNEIDAAKTVHVDQLNVQDQQRFSWPASFPLARAYLDQLERSGGLGAKEVAAARTALAKAEKGSGQGRRTTLQQLASQLGKPGGVSTDPARIQMLLGTVNGLAAQP